MIKIIQSLGNQYDYMISSSFNSLDHEDQSNKQTFSGLATLFRNSIGVKFLNVFEEMIEVKPILQQNEQSIADSWQKINKIIDEIEGYINKKLQNHQKQVFEIVNQQMKEMNNQIRKLIFQLNKKINQKNQSQEVWYLHNQLDYFKNQALKLFSINKEMKIEIKILRKTIKEYQMQLSDKSMTLYKIKKKHLKQKMSNKKTQMIGKAYSMRQNLNENIEIQKKVKFNEGIIVNKKRVITEISSMTKTQLQRQNGLFDEQSRVNIQISNKSYAKNTNDNPIIITYEDQQKSVQNTIIPNASCLSKRSNKYHKRFQSMPDQRVIRRSADKITQTQQNYQVKQSHKQTKNQQFEDDNIEGKFANFNLFRSGFKIIATNRKHKKAQLPLRNSVDYHKNGQSYIRSMNSSFLKNRGEDNLGIKQKKQAYLIKRDSFL